MESVYILCCCAEGLSVADVRIPCLDPLNFFPVESENSLRLINLNDFFCEDNAKLIIQKMGKYHFFFYFSLDESVVGGWNSLAFLRSCTMNKLKHVKIARRYCSL